MTSTEPNLTTFQKKLAERRAKEEEEKARQKAEAEAFPSDLIPEFDTSGRSEDEQAIDTVIDRIDILDAYQRWCGKMKPKVGAGQRESIMISCPIPGHIDENPSAWINLDKQVWHCGGCEQGGDKYDLAAMAHGFSDYKEGANFHRLREAMAIDFGYVLQKSSAGKTLLIPPEETAPEAPDAPTPENVISIIDDDYDPNELVGIPDLDWRRLCPPDTFLDTYMKAVVLDDVPEEYHFFHGLLALGFALGRDVALHDLVPVYGNLFICTLGRSGMGKSKARRHLDVLLNRALPFDRSNILSKGVLKVNAPASAEALIHQFQRTEVDPNNPKMVYHYPVRGLIDFNELSALVARANRQGNALKPHLMQFYDMDDIVQTVSMASGSKEAHEPFASALTTTQPRALRSLIDATDDASGFLNRWLFVPGKEKKKFAIGGNEIDMSPAIKPLQEILGWAGSRAGLKVPLSSAARWTWEQFFYDRVDKDQKKSTNDMLVRMDLLLKKLILLLGANRHEEVISEQSVVDTISMYPYLKAAYGIPASQIGNQLFDDVADRLREILISYEKKFGKPPTKRDINDRIKSHMKSHNYNSEFVGRVLKSMINDQNCVDEQNFKQNGPGRPTLRYKYVG